MPFPDGIAGSDVFAHGGMCTGIAGSDVFARISAEIVTLSPPDWVDQ